MPSAAAELEGVPEESIEFGYCTEFFIVHLDPAFCEEDLDVFREHLMRLGDSVVVAYDAGVVKVHVHSNAPGKVLQMALRLGELDRLKIENMREQNRALQAERKRSEKEYAMVAVSAGDGIESVFRELMVDHVIAGGQTMNPSTEDILNEINRTPAETVFVFPNNKNIIMAAEQCIPLTEKRVVVIPTKTVPQGITALLSLDETASEEEITEGMAEAIAGVHTALVTYAARDSDFDGHEIHAGEYLALLDGALVGSYTNIDTLLDELSWSVDELSPAVISVYYGEAVTEADANAAAKKLGDHFPDAELSVVNGGQPVYYYMISIE